MPILLISLFIWVGLICSRIIARQRRIQSEEPSAPPPIPPRESIITADEWRVQ